MNILLVGCIGVIYMADKKKNELMVRDKAELVKKQTNVPVKKDGKKPQEKGPNAFIRAYNFIAKKLKEMWSELKKVTWPTAKHSWKQTGVVIAVVLFFLVALMGIDSLFTFLLRTLVNR